MRRGSRSTSSPRHRPRRSSRRAGCATSSSRCGSCRTPNVSADEIAAGALAGYDAVLIPNGPGSTGVSDLGEDGAQALRDWLNGGGHLIAWRGGTELAAELGLTTAVLADPTSDVPGSLFRVRLDPDSELRRGVGDEAYAFYEYDNVMRASSPEHVAVEFPPADSADWFVSGFAAGAEELGGTAAVVDEPVGRGRTTVFSVEPNFRAFTTGFQKLLRNAVLGDDAAIARTDVASARRKAPVRVTPPRGSRAARRRSGSPCSRRAPSPRRASSIRSARGTRHSAARGRVAYLIANPRRADRRRASVRRRAARGARARRGRDDRLPRSLAPNSRVRAVRPAPENRRARAAWSRG